MINFRFHLVSLVAVFLALAAGIVIGSTVVDRAIVEGLRDRIDDVEARADSARAENAELADEAGRAADELDARAPFSVEDRLRDAPVVVLAMRGTDEQSVEGQVRRLEEAGADVPVVGWLEEAWSLEEDSDVDALREVVGLPIGDELLRRTAFGSLAERLGRGVIERADASPNAAGDAPDALDDLTRAGFVTLDQISDRDQDEMQRWPLVRPYVVLITTSGPAADVPGIEAQLARSFAARGVDIVVSDVMADGEDSERGARVSTIRDSSLADGVATVDHGESSTGQVAAILALVEAAGGTVSHYGYGSGSERPFPEWARP